MFKLKNMTHNNKYKSNIYSTHYLKRDLVSFQQWCKRKLRDKDLYSQSPTKTNLLINAKQLISQIKINCVYLFYWVEMNCIWLDKIHVHAMNRNHLHYPLTRIILIIIFFYKGNFYLCKDKNNNQQNHLSSAYLVFHASLYFYFTDTEFLQTEIFWQSCMQLSKFISQLNCQYKGKF